MSAPPGVLRRLMREINELKKSPPEGIRIATSDDNMLDVTGIIEGPEGTPYAGGYFRVKFKFTDEFPAAPPKCWFASKIFHPNVSAAGEICVNTLKKDWKSSYGLSHILITVKCLLIYPNPESALDEEAGKLLLENYDSYCARAKLITSIHATPKVRPVEFDTPPKAEASTSKLLVPSPLPTPYIGLGIPSPAPATLRKSSSPAPPTHPLQSSPSSNTASENSTATPTVTDKDVTKDRHASPAPLGTADANVSGGKGMGMGPALPAPVTKAVKRSATTGTGAEKRKKALKRL